MRTSTTQNILYDYRYLNLKEEVRCNLNDAFNLRRDFTKVEDEETFSISERVLIMGGVVGAVTCLYFFITYLV